MDLKQLIDSVNLVTLFEQSVGQPVNTGRWLLYHCPCHADRHPSLAIGPDRDRWHCFGRCNTSGDALDWLRLRYGLPFAEARSELLRLTRMPSLSVSHHARHPALPLATDEPPPARWQQLAVQVIDFCTKMLWTQAGQRARSWLHRRGLNDETLRHWQIGFNPSQRRIGDLFVPRGIVIPNIECGAETSQPMRTATVWSLKIRRASGTPKYVQVAGSRPALFGAQTIPGHSIGIVTEGEFDAMLVHQHAGDQFAAMTLGSASTRPRIRWLGKLFPIGTLLVVYDRDAAGQKGADWWAGCSARVHTTHVPIGKDLTDFVLAGGDLRAFLQFELRRLCGIPPRPTPNSLPTPAPGFPEFNSAAVSRAISLEASMAEGGCNG